MIAICMGMVNYAQFYRQRAHSPRQPLNIWARALFFMGTFCDFFLRGCVVIFMCSLPEYSLSNGHKEFYFVPYNWSRLFEGRTTTGYALLLLLLIVYQYLQELAIWSYYGGYTVQGAVVPACQSMISWSKVWEDTEEGKLEMNFFRYEAVARAVSTTMMLQIAPWFFSDYNSTKFWLYAPGLAFFFLIELWTIEFFLREWDQMGASSMLGLALQCVAVGSFFVFFLD